MIHKICTSSLNMHTLYETTEEDEVEESENKEEIIVEEDSDCS